MFDASKYPFMLRVLLFVMSSSFVMGCGVKIPQGDVMNTLLRELTIEETRLLKTCHDLQVHHPEQVRLVLDQDKTPMLLKNELLHEMRTSLGTLFRLLQVEKNCDANQALNYYLNVQKFKTRVAEQTDLPQQCLAQLTSRFDQFKTQTTQTINDSKSSINSELSQVMKVMINGAIKEGLTPQELLDDPLKLIRQIDLSMAVVSAILTLADQTDSMAQKLSATVPVGSGIARVVIDRFAAELLALTLEQVLNSLESKQLLSRTAVSRQACAVYQRGRVHSAVTERVLKRLVLRFHQNHSLQEPQKETEEKGSWVAFCTLNQDICSDLLSEAQLVNASPVPWSKVSIKEITQTLQPQLPQVDYSLEAVQRSIQYQSQLLTSVAKSCTEQAQCTPKELGDRAGVIATLI